MHFLKNPGNSLKNGVMFTFFQDIGVCPGGSCRNDSSILPLGIRRLYEDPADPGIPREKR